MCVGCGRYEGVCRLWVGEGVCRLWVGEGVSIEWV